MERQVYHSGAIVGNDVNKLTKTANIKQLSNVFKPAIIQLQNGSQKELSSHEKVVKINTLLTKFQQCYNLYSLSRPLCRHEVALFGIRCSSIGCWFPTAFPSVSIIPKFHVLTHHFPEKASIRRTIGKEAEHSSETIHTVVNSLSRTYHTVPNVKRRLELIFKTQSLRSNRTLQNFRKPVKRVTKNHSKL